MTGAHRKKKHTPRDTIELFVDIRENKRKKTWEATCKFAPCTWKDSSPSEFIVSKAWVQHFNDVHVARWDQQ